jgi:alkanesulfonate monooxygenase SsuD/methylene tetrahydromethanopterin reductase-like flavin-dependent oxidoreductase (luciferase family)
MIPLSVLDLSVVTTGTRPAAALQNSIDLARHVDGLGYVRYWLAEHHNLASVASPAPDLMIGQIAAVTKNIRVGSRRTRCAAGSTAGRATTFSNA